MTVTSIEVAIELVEEMLAYGDSIGSVWQYTNRMNKQELFAVFPASQYCDIHEALHVKDPVQIWGNGKWLIPFDHLN